MTHERSAVFGILLPLFQVMEYTAEMLRSAVADFEGPYVID